MTANKSIQTAFRPGRETAEPERFAGRRSQIEQGCRLLAARDHIFIHGVQGIGKSSLARQLALIASGDARLLARIQSDYATESFDFATAVLTRDDSIRNINSLIYRLMKDEGALAQWDTTPVPAFALDGALSPDIVSEFLRRLRRIGGTSGDGIALFVDEFERIPDRLGFASILKAMPDQCVFVITGVGRTERELVSDHQSIVRQLGTGKLLVDAMSPAELRIVVETAEADVAPFLTFADSARERIVELADGQPYLLHVIGKATLNRAVRDGTGVVSCETIELALGDIARGSSRSFLEDRYHVAIGASRQRETVLRVFAESDHDSMSATNAYQVARVRGVRNPSACVGDLVKAQFGAELERVADQTYRFTDPLLKAYVRATPVRLAAGAEEDVTPQVPIPQRDFAIVHLSDLHFGDKHFFSSLPMARESIPEQDRPSLERSLLNAFDHSESGLVADAAMFSGDFTQGATTPEFDAARGFVLAVQARLGKGATQYASPTRVVVVPGNHDVNWAMVLADPCNRSMGFAPYMKFCRDLGVPFDLGVAPERLFYVSDFRPDLPLLVGALNSNVLEGPSEHRAYVGDSQVQACLAEFRLRDPQQDCVRIVMMHHHLVPVPSIESTLDEPGHVVRDAAKVKAALLDAGVALVLHGHRHHPHEEVSGDHRHRMVIIGAGSAGVAVTERGEQPLHFNQINFRLTFEAVEIVVQRFHFDGGRGRWLHDPRLAKSYSIPRVRVQC